MQTSGASSPDSQRLRRYLRDLAALTALPAVWTGGDCYRIADSLADVLVKVLPLDFIYVRLEETTAEGALEVVRPIADPADPERARTLGRALAPWLTGATADHATLSLPHLFGDDLLDAAFLPIGYGGEFGVLAAASRQMGFPSEEDRLLLSVVVSQAAVVLQRRQAEQARRESEQRFAEFMQHLPGLAWIKDGKGRYVYANDAAMKIFRRLREQLYGRTDAEIFPPDTAAQFREHDRRALASEAGVQVIETLEHEDGMLHYSIVNKFPMPGPDGMATLVGGVAFDITDRIRAEQALQEADRLKDEFLAMLAHELRNPLAPVRNALHIIKQQATSGAAIEQAMEMAERQVRHMARLLDDLLDVSRISRGTIELRKEIVDVTTIVNRSVETVRPLFQERHHQLTVSLPPEPIRVEADPTRLEQVLTNLLNNAAKYTDPGGSVRLIVERIAGWVVLRVRDNGIGIAPEMLPRVFDLFVQAERRLDRSQGGVGIGLTLVRKLVELHGGWVEALSAGVGQGSEFVARLPAVREAPTASEAELSARDTILSSTPRRRVLVVDDNVDAADSLAMLLRLGGQEVRAAYDGPTALLIAKAFRPQVVLLDIGMPGMDGYDVARRLRALPELQSATLAALTGWGQQSDQERSREAGFDHHLVKPVEPEELQKLLADLELRGSPGS